MLRIIMAVLLVCWGVLQAPAIAQQPYPTRPIRLIVPYSAGGASDVMARYFGDRLGALLKQPVIIENQAAAAGTIAYANVARAQPDGYTLAYGTSSLAVNAALRRNAPYDPVRDFTPVSPFLVVQNVLVAPTSLPANSVAELVALAKQKPGELNYVSLGRGSTPHLSMELFRSAAGITVEQVPYKNTPQAYTDLIEGRVQLWLASMPSALPFIRSGKLRALAVAGAKRSPALPMFRL
jgi:tripartite-type tricarboxylate transporter receptor subunit TctC